MSALGGLASWAEFVGLEPAMAASGRALLCHGGGVPIGFLATASARAAPHLAPVCPIFCDDFLYLSVGARTPKRRDLDRDGRYALHAFLGRRDDEFCATGVAERVDDDAARQAVQAAITFAAFGRADPIYRLWLATCLHGWWEHVGQPETRPVRRRWRAPGTR